MAEKITNATRLTNSLTAQAVEQVAQVNGDKQVTPAQWFAAVQRTFETLLTKALDDLAKEDTPSARRLTHDLILGLAQDGHAN